MQLILAIDSDPRRSEQLANLVRARLQVDLVQATSAGEGLHALRDRVPDLILTSPLLSPFDDGVLDEYLRDLGSAATHVQTVRIPMLSSGPRKKSAATRLFSLGRKKKQTSSAAAPDGCDPKVFADEIAHYLTRSLEERSGSVKTSQDQKSWQEPGPAPLDYARSRQADEEWDAPPALVEEFRARIEQAPRQVKAAPVVEPPHVPGSILDLRPASPKPRDEGGAPIVHAPIAPAVGGPEPEPSVETEPSTDTAPEPIYVEPVPTYVMPEPTYVVPEPTYVMPEPRYAQPEPTYVTPEPRYVQPEPPAPVASRAPFDAAQGQPVVKPASVSAPARAATTTANSTSGNSASFEAALAAIRAAWAKPEPTASTPEPKQTMPAQAAPRTPAATGKPLSGEVDLTNQIEDLGNGTLADQDNSPDGSTAPNARRKTEKPTKRQETPRGRKTQGADGRDEWGVFDPSQCEFSTLVDKLDEVTDSDEPKPRTTNLR
jgi:hypothetical protein